MKNPESQSQSGPTFLGGSEVGELIRSRNWSDSLGPMEHWPRSLQIALGIALSSGFPLYIAWGPQLIQLYNDAYRPIIGEKGEAVDHARE